MRSSPPRRAPPPRLLQFVSAVRGLRLRARPRLQKLLFSSLRRRARRQPEGIYLSLRVGSTGEKFLKNVTLNVLYDVGRVFGY
jgi:hypothetical protein